jgi:OOP family OmpA-OmpF porin
MKKQLLVAMIGAALAVPFAAQAEGAYVGVNAGSAKQTASSSGYSGNDSETGFKLYGGYDFTQNFGIEGGYIDLGNANISNGPISASIKSTALYVAGTATLPLNTQFSLFAKLGVTENRAESIGYPTNTKTSALIGVGAAYNINKNLSVVAEYEDFGKVYEDPTANIKADMFSVGLRYKF